VLGGLVGVATVERASPPPRDERLYGARWDYEVAVEDLDADAVVAALARERDVRPSARGPGSRPRATSTSRTERLRHR
jgi:hypothetical protein